jgi:hypothetical protein
LNDINEKDFERFRYWSFAIDEVKANKISSLQAIKECEKWVDFEINKGKILPWFTFGATNLLANILKNAGKDFFIFEYGSGSSTRYIENFDVQLVSVEHDAIYYSKLVTQLKKRETKYKLIVPELNIQNEVYKSSVNEQLNFEKYVKSVNEYDEIDMVIVDGRARVACCYEAWKRIKVDGWLILDDSERLAYKNAIDFILIDKPEVYRYYGSCPGVSYMKETLIFRKIK